MIKQDLRIVELEKEQESIVKRIADIKIVSQETLQGAVSFTQEIKKAKKKVEDLRKFLVQPLQDHVKTINSKFKPLTESLDEAERRLKGGIICYQTVQEEIRRREEEKLRKQQEKKYEKQVEKAETKGEIAPPPPAPINIEKPKVEGLKIIKRWAFAIENVNEIPREYMIPDLVKIRKVVQAGVHEIKGLKIFQETSSAIGLKSGIDEL